MHQIVDVKIPYEVIQCIIKNIWGKIEMSTITIIENDLRRSKFVD